MPETIIIDGKMKNVAQHCMWAIMVKKSLSCEKEKEKDTMGEVFNLPPNSKFPLTLTVEMKINGVEVSFEHYLERLNQEFDRFVKKKAHELLENMCGDVYERMCKMRDMALDKLPNGVIL